MNRTRTAALSFAWISIGALVANIAAYFLRLLLARSLPVREYGLVYAIMAFAGLAGIFIHWGLGEAVLQSIASNPDPGRARSAIFRSLRLLFLSTGVLAFIMILAAPWLSATYFHEPLAAPLMMIYAASIFLSPTSVILLSAFLARGRAGLYAAYTVAQPLLLLSITWFALSSGWGAAGAIIAYPITLLLLHGFVPFLRSTIPKFWRAKTANAPTVRDLLNYGLPVMLTGLAGMILSSTDTVMLTAMRGLDEVGIYQAALPTANILLFLVSVVTVVLLPITAELWTKRKRALLASALRDLYGYVFIGLLPLILAALVFPDLILNLLFGAQYVSGAPILRLLAISALILTLNAVTAATLSGMGKPILTTRAVMAGAIVNVILNFLLIPHYGGAGAAAATLGSSVVIAGIAFNGLQRHVRIEIPIGRWIKALFAGAAFWFVLVLVRALPIFNQYAKATVAVLLASIVYAIALFCVRAISWPELRDLWTRVVVRRT